MTFPSLYSLAANFCLFTLAKMEIAMHQTHFESARFAALLVLSMVSAVGSQAMAEPLDVQAVMVPK